MKTLNPLKVPFGTTKGVALRGVRYLQWEDAFEVDFEDGLTFLEPMVGQIWIVTRKCLA
jgi:hypothetical protein